MEEPLLNIIEQTLNHHITGKEFILLVISAIIWEIIYLCIIKKILYKFYPSSDFATALIEIGGFGILGIALFIAILVILLIASVQLVISNWIAIFPCILFWGLIGTLAFLFIRAMIRKK